MTKYALPKPAPCGTTKALAITAETQTFGELLLDASCQTEELINHLEEAKSLLKLLESSKDAMSVSMLPKENDPIISNTTVEYNSGLTKSKRTAISADSNAEQLLEGEIIKLTKETNLLRR